MRRLVLTALVLGSAASLPAAAAAQAQVFLNINPTWSIQELKKKVVAKKLRFWR